MKVALFTVAVLLPNLVLAGDFVLKSPVLKNGETMPKAFTADGADRSPPLEWSGVPRGTKSLALLVDDPDAPRGIFVHWVLYDIPPTVSKLSEGTVPKEAVQGVGSSGKAAYKGPSPPPGPAHHYVFTLYALGANIPKKPKMTKDELLAAMKDHVIEETSLTVTYGR